jgi:hypothetical protein
MDYFGRDGFEDLDEEIYLIICPRVNWQQRSSRKERKMLLISAVVLFCLGAPALGTITAAKPQMG